MMVDPHRPDLRYNRNRSCRQGCGQNGNRAIKHLFSNFRDQPHGDAQRDHRNDHHGRGLCACRTDQWLQQQKHQRQRHLDPARPVHRLAVRFANAILRGVKPALPAEPVPQLHHTQLIVRIPADAAADLAASDQNQDRADREPDQHEPPPRKGLISGHSLPHLSSGARHYTVRSSVAVPAS